MKAAISVMAENDNEIELKAKQLYLKNCVKMDNAEQ